MFQGRCDRRQQVLRAYVVMKLGPFHHARRLIAHATEQQRSSARVQNVGEVLDGMETGRIDSGHVTQAKDDHPGQAVDLTLEIEQLVGAAEQERPVDPEHRHVVGNLLQLCRLCARP